MKTANTAMTVPASRDRDDPDVRSSQEAADFEFLRPLSIFDGLGDSALLRLGRELQTRELHCGDIVFYQGDPGATCYLIQQGRVRIFLLDEDGHELSVRVLGPGELIGEMALFDNQPRSASAVAMTEIRLLILHQDMLRHALREHPDFAVNLLQTLSKRLRQSNEQAGQLASMTVEDRVLRQIEKFAEWTGKPTPTGTRITMPLNQSDLASLVGTSRESVNRALRNLRIQGKLRIRDGCIEIADSIES